MRATNYARATYQEVYDVMTRDGKVSIFGFHTPTGDAPYSMLHGFFSQFRKYRYSGMKVNVIPAAQLPADPLQISYEAGTESYIDPRDLQNPVLFHGAHGSNLGEVLNMIYSEQGMNWTSPSIDYREPNVGDGPGNPSLAAPRPWDFEDWYNASMLDPSFRKFNVMNNMSLPFMSPRVHNLAANLSIQPAYTTPQSFVVDYPQIEQNGSEPLTDNDGFVTGVNPQIPYLQSNGVVIGNTTPVQLMTNRLMKLGWMDTFTFSKAENSTAEAVPTVSPLPRIMMGALILPPSYRTKLAFRIVISHFFEFARFNTSINAASIHRNPGSIAIQASQNYHNYLPDEITSTNSVMEADSIDAINGDVRQSVSGIM